MGCHRARHRRSGLPAAAMAAVLAVTACSAEHGSAAGTAAATPAVPVAAEINQLRDNYSKQIVSIQLTNTSGGVVTVLGARLGSALFTAGISWQGPPGGIELPPGQTKSLPAQLPPPVCGPAAGSAEDAATVSIMLAAAPPAAATPLATAPAATLPAADPFGVLSRNNTEMCLAQAASAAAGFRLDPGLDVSADGRTAVVRLLITPRDAGPADEPATLTIDRIDGTTLLAEDPAVPWPRAVPVRAGGPAQELRLGIRPARCDAHAVAEDKVGTLLPLRVTAGAREGVLKIDAGAVLRGRIYDFVTAACAPQ
ncbi:hypothetical protein [Arthrobacter sp. UYCu712]|uniref:hypothetical protein n=1 Tax=Arthrobacter sp. UYCu712 TaxID=3156340 RepID=UPI003395CCE0